MPTEHAAKIRIYTFLSDVAIKGQAKSPAPFSIGTISKKYGGIVPHIVPIELQKPLFYAAGGKEKNPVYTQNNTCTLDKSPIIVYN